MPPASTCPCGRLLAETPAGPVCSWCRLAQCTCPPLANTQPRASEVLSEGPWRFVCPKCNATGRMPSEPKELLSCTACVLAGRGIVTVIVLKA